MAAPRRRRTPATTIAPVAADVGKMMAASTATADGLSFTSTAMCASAHLQVLCPARTYWTGRYARPGAMNPTGVAVDGSRGTSGNGLPFATSTVGSSPVRHEARRRPCRAQRQYIDGSWSLGCTAPSTCTRRPEESWAAPDGGRRRRPSSLPPGSFPAWSTTAPRAGPAPPAIGVALRLQDELAQLIATRSACR